MESVPNQQQPEPSPATAQYRTISGFWRRVAAFIVDVIILAIIGGILSLFLSDFFMALGDYGTLVGFSIALAYFGYCNSSLGKGQTLGKRLLKIEVVNANGEYLSPATATLRYAILGFPFFITADFLPNSLKYTWFYFVIVGLLVAWVVATLYLLIFNRRTRQCPHDYLAHSYVVTSGSNAPIEVVPLWKWHRLILTGLLFWLAISMVSSVYLTTKFKFFTDLLQIQKTVAQTPGIRDVGVTAGKNMFYRDGKTVVTTQMAIIVRCQNRSESKKQIARHVAQLVLDHFPEATQKDYLTIRVSHGYSIGIYSSSAYETFHHSPSEWKTILNDPLEEP